MMLIGWPTANSNVEDFSNDKREGKLDNDIPERIVNSFAN